MMMIVLSGDVEFQLRGVVDLLPVYILTYVNPATFEPC
jgi:hypothetical protein